MWGELAPPTAPRERLCHGRRLALRSGGVLAQQAGDLLAGHRLAEVEALADVAAHAAQGQELGRVLDPLGHGDQLEALAEADDGPGQLGVVAVGRAYTLSYASHFNGFPPPTPV